MKKKNIQAFTLMELLAVLVILAIIALIVFPIIGDVITDSKMKAFKSSVDGLEHAVDLDYQKDYYKGDREYSYEGGHLTLNSVKGESKNKNIKVEGIIENGVGIVSVDKDGNTSLIIYNDEYCAVKDFTDKTITVEEKKERNCMIPTPAYCFETEEAIILESYDINLENCKVALSHSSYSEEDKIAICTKGQTTSDGYSLEKGIEEHPEAIDELTSNKIIENVVYNEFWAITEYKCYEGNTYGYETITDVVIPSHIHGNTILMIGTGAFEWNGIKNVELSNNIIKIGSGAFEGNDLSNVFIPSSVKEIGTRAFACNYTSEKGWLKNLTYEDPNNLPNLGSDIFSEKACD